MNNSTDNNINIIFEGHVFRDSSSRLIIPDDIYDALASLKSSSSYEFAMQIRQILPEAASNYNYYAAWFILVKNDGGLKKCIKASKVKGAKDSNAINEMVESGKIVLSQVSINSAEEVFESKLKNSTPQIDDKKAEESYSNFEKQLKSIESELCDIKSNLVIKSEGDYNDLKYRLTELKDRNYYSYSKILGFSYGNETITKDAEKMYNILEAKIDAVSGKLEILRDEKFDSGVKTGKDYYTYSDEKYPSIIETKLKEIINDINQYSDNNYAKIKRNFSDLYNDTYSVYQLILNSATEIDCMTKVLLDEAIRKYKEVIGVIGKEEARLETLHSQNKPMFGSLVKKPLQDK